MDSREGRFLRKLDDKLELIEMFLKSDAMNTATYEDFAYRDELLSDVGVDFKQHEDTLRAKEGIEVERKAFELRFVSLRSKFKHLIRIHLPKENHVVKNDFDQFIQSQTKLLDEISNVNRKKLDVKLPSINIPQFGGSYYEWPTFENLFMQIHNNTRVSKIQKFQYLKGLMVPNSIADELIKHFTITENNYDEAWQKLSNRFNKQRHIITAYVRKFIDQPSTTNSVSVTSLRALCDTTDHVMRGLRSLGEQAEKRDPFLIYLLLEKIDDDSKHLWARETCDNDHPTITELIHFLEKRCDALESVQSTVSHSKPSKVNSSSNSKSNSHGSNRVSSFASNLSATCPKCNQNHLLHDCATFKSMNVSDRQHFVVSKSLCFNCLRPGHRSNNCRGKFSCHKCSKRHHTLIHLVPTNTFNSPTTSAIVTNNALNSQNYNDSTHTQSDSNTKPSQSKPTISSSLCITDISTDDNALFSNQILNQSTNYGPETPVYMHSDIAQLHVADDNQINSLLSSRDSNFMCNTLLPTANVFVLDSSNQLQCCRGLLDSGSQATFITESLAQRLSLRRYHAKKLISGLGSTSAGYSRGYVVLQVFSKSHNKVLSVQALVLRTLTTVLPPSFIDITSWDYIKSLTLADPMFNQSNSIDILIGIEHALDVFTGKVHHGPAEFPSARETVFGWVMAGRLPIGYTDSTASHHSESYVNVNDTLDRQLRIFWEIENLPEANLLTDDEKRCEELFSAGVKRLSSGRFSVRLPFKSTFHPIGNSLNKAIARLNSMERVFKRNPEVKKEYTKFIKEYIALHHMVEIPENEINVPDNQCFYLPHHAVIKENSTTTKLRVVFDGSSKTNTGYSINDNLHIGEMLQPKLFSVLLKFRRSKIAMVADIEKMFRQIEVHEDRDYQRIVWRNNEYDPIQHYRLSTVTYGLACSPFLATRTLREFSNIIREREPFISKIIDDQFYVDDLMMGSENLNEAIKLRTKMSNLLLSAGFTLRKWKSNNEEFLGSIPQDLTEQTPLEIQESEASFKILGMQWSPKLDCFIFNVKPASSEIPSKRTILSEMASIYDPLGLLAPSVVLIKIMLQTLWLRNVEWDDRVPEDIERSWFEIRRQFDEFNTVHIARYINGQSPTHSIEIHGFADASERAYAAAVYLRFCDNNNVITVHLVAAKTKVAPLKTISIPRLELCAALLLVKLINAVKLSLDLGDVKLVCWSDSMTVLAWLSDHPSRWKTFVANRTSEILEIVDRSSWYHVRSSENAADCASRGLMPRELKTFDMWWHGPQFLRHIDYAKSIVNIQQSESDNIVKNEERSKITCNSATAQSTSINEYHDIFHIALQHCSTWFKLSRVFSFVLRFVRNCRSQHSRTSISTAVLSNSIPPLTSDEIRTAQHYILKQVQDQKFSRDSQQISRKGKVSHRSNLKSLAPFIHTDGLLRVGGRLSQSVLPFDTKHQIILPKEDPITNLIIQHYHINHFHAGTTLLISLLRQRYWIIQCRNVIRRTVYNCVKCFRDRATTITQIMGELPASRTVCNISPFTHTGIDYAGPFYLKDDKIKKAKVYKGYIVIFVCFSTKAIHIEVVKDLSTEAFIAALRKFISRRGNPSVIHTDNGLTFVGANRELKRLFNFMMSDAHTQAVTNELSRNLIKWQFIPPHSPHFGGLWEAGVKSVKQHLKKAISNIIATHDEMSTMLYQIEALLNSRPICALSDDPLDLNYLTPGHFLIGKPLTMIPEPDLAHVAENRLSQWQCLQKRVQGFWKTWQMEYLTSLQQRPKWRHPVQNIKVNDLVLLKDDTLSAGKWTAAPAGKWNSARVVKCYPGKDGQVRVVDLKTKDGIYQRPVHKLCLLPLNN